jgi:hypothetical protein
MALTRNELLARLMEHMSSLERDMAHLHVQSRGWAQGSKAHLSLRQVEKDFRLFEARLKALIGEIEHLEAKNRQFTCESVSPVRYKQPDPSPPPIPPSEPASAPVAPVDDFQQVEEQTLPPEPPAPSSASSDARRRLSEMAKDLPPSVLAELRKSGLE